MNEPYNSDFHVYVPGCKNNDPWRQEEMWLWKDVCIHTLQRADTSLPAQTVGDKTSGSGL